MILLLLSCSGSPTDSSPPLDEALAVVGPPLIVEVGQAASFTSEGSLGSAFTWDFGDGSQSEEASPTHAYEQAGNYTAVLQVRSSGGDLDSASLRVMAHAPLTERQPVWSGTLAVDGEDVWLVVPEAGTLVHLRPAEDSVEHIAVCERPRNVAIYEASVGVSCEDDQLVVWNDGDLRRVELPTGSHPYAVLGAEEGWWLSLPATGELARVVGSTVETHDIGPDPRSLSVDSEGRLLSARWRSPDEGAEIYVLGGDTIVLPVDTRPDSDTTTGGVPNLLEAVVPSPDGQTLLVPALQANSRRGTFLSGEDLSHETALVATLSLVDAETGQSSLDEREQFDDKGRAITAAPHWTGNLWYVLHPATQSISVFDPFTGERAGSFAEVGRGAIDLRYAEGLLYVNAWLDRELRVYDAETAELVWSASTVESEPLEPQVLLGKQLFWDALDTRITRDGYIACANCHPDGREDGRTWDFTNRGEGLRNTTSLEGRAGTAMGPVHWTGNFDEIQDFENDIRGHFAGTGLLSDADWEATSDPNGPAKAGRSEDLDALAAYVTSLAESPRSPWPEADDDAFLEAGCAECHPAPLYTDSELSTRLRHDVGTLTEASGGRLGAELDGLDTPTLLGAWDTAPYLHDGSAPTLEAAVRAHDSAQDLSEAQITEIVQFIRAL